MLTVEYTILPTGGAVQLNIDSDAATITITRVTTSSGTSVTLYNGAPIPLYIDAGDGTPTALLHTETYQYTVTDSSGDSYQTPVLSAAGTVSIDEDFMTPLLIRLLTGAMQSLVLPPGIKAANVLHAMPLNGAPRMPLVTLNLDLMQQADDGVPLGQQVVTTPINPAGSIWTIQTMVEWRYTISILSYSAQERDFYRQSLISVLSIMLKNPIESMGRNISHRWQISSGQVSGKDNDPGFYTCDIAFEFTGNFNTSVQTMLGIVEAIDGTSNISMAGSTAPAVTDTFEIT